ncbi:hypothetical protein ACFFWC_14600 [Plantactinospora siamensis]|uniref:Nucleotidase n=1 Tax=Plantactinospora siamensis TaxID=555372 RepID=A0ABV6P119_9ACTN
MLRIGVDVGGVLIEPSDDDEDTSFFGPNFLHTPAVPGALDGLAALIRTADPDNVFLVSKCGESTEERTRQWLSHHDAFRRTGLRPEHLRFCRTRPAKAPIARDLALTHFVDDKLEVLSYLTSVPHRYLFRPREPEVAAHAGQLPAVRRVESWPELVAALTAG